MVAASPIHRICRVRGRQIASFTAFFCGGGGKLIYQMVIELMLEFDPDRPNESRAMVEHIPRKSVRDPKDPKDSELHEGIQGGIPLNAKSQPRVCLNNEGEDTLP